MMFYAVYDILVLTEAAGTTPPSAEAILDQAFYLVMTHDCPCGTCVGV